MAVIFETLSNVQTQRLGRMLGREIVRSGIAGPLVVGLVGELGAGKTTFLQGFARGLGVRGSVRSPTFVLMKTYPLPKLQTLIHIDCYRLDQPAELLKLGLRDILADPRSLVVVEWADRIKKMLPKSTLWIRFEHNARPEQRIIRI